MSTPVDPVSAPSSSQSVFVPGQRTAPEQLGSDPPQRADTDTRVPYPAIGYVDDEPRTSRAGATTERRNEASALTNSSARTDADVDPEPAIVGQPVRHTAPVRETVVSVQEPEPMPEPFVGLMPDRDTVLARERSRFGGMKLGSAFFGWLTATGLAVLLLSVLAAAGVVFGVTSTANLNNAVQQAQQGTGTAKTVGLIGAIVLLVVLFLAYYCGGYVAARMSRFNGIRQGFAVWLWAIFTSAIIAALAAIAGSKYNVLAQLNLPRIPVKEGSVTTVGLIAIGAAILAALLGALLGGALGTRYHRKVDAVGFEER